MPWLGRRKELAGRRVQPVDQHDVLPDAEHLRPRVGDPGTKGWRSTSSRPASSWRRVPTSSAPWWAISAETGERTWLREQRAATYSLVTTGGGLLFGGDGNGRFRAFDQETGEVLWEINLGSPVSGFPITYAVDGRQYVAASTSGKGVRVDAGAPPECGQQPLRVRPAGPRLSERTSHEDSNNRRRIHDLHTVDWCSWSERADLRTRWRRSVLVRTGEP